MHLDAERGDLEADVGGKGLGDRGDQTGAFGPGLGLVALADGRQTDALSGATPYLRLFGLTATTAMLVRGALADMDAPESAGRAALARFAAANLAPETKGLAASATAGAEGLADASAALA